VTAPPRFFGLFEELRRLDLPATDAEELYEGFHAGLYDRLTAADDYDLPHYLERARATGGPILELACGSGRIAVPLARAGFEVTGLDLAPDMLRRLRRGLLDEPPEVAARVRAVQADMREPPIDRPYRLAILGALSVCLLHAHADRVRCFAAVARALGPGGTFCLDFLETSAAALRAQDAEVVTLPEVAPPVKRFTLLGRRWLPEHGLQLVNFYSEEVDPLGRTRRHLGSTAKAIVAEHELRAQLDEAGLDVEAAQTVRQLGDGDAAERIRLLTCAVRADR
jgi:SAM-dependent methyltransferase